MLGFEKHIRKVGFLDRQEIDIKINFSSYDIISQCLRKAKFRLIDLLEREEEAPALTTGTGVHKAMEVWYSAPSENRKRSSLESDESIDLLLAGLPPLPGADARVAAIDAYLKATKVLEGNISLGARDRFNVCQILNAYFDFYLTDTFEVYTDNLGPFIERSFEYLITTFEYQGYVVNLYFHGTIDEILYDQALRELVVTDHKSTYALGQDFFNRIYPNWQYVGYFMAAKKHFGLPVKKFMVNGIQVAKEKRDFKRQYVEPTEADFEELTSSFVEVSKRFIEAHFSQNWSMSAPNACSMWNGCEYKKICELPKGLQAGYIQANYRSN